MAEIEQAWLTNPSRRKAIARVAGLVAASPLAAPISAALAQTDPRPLSEHHRVLSLPEMQTVFDFEPVFFGNVVRPIYNYTAHGDGSEFTLRRNRLAYDWGRYRAGTRAISASQVDPSSELLGVKMKIPIIVAPTAAMVPLHPDGEIGMFKAATTASNTLMMLNVNTSTPHAKVVPAAPGRHLLGAVYPVENRETTQRTMENFQNAGCNGIIVTVDQQACYYERTQQDRDLGGRVVRAGGPGGGGRAAAGAPTGAGRYRVNGFRLWYTWQYIDDMRKMVKGPLLIKGILEPEDAKLAIEHGADAIIVSNHGGRSMDYAPSTLEVLPEIVATVNGRIPVVFDSGIPRGTDIFKARRLKYG